MWRPFESLAPSGARHVGYYPPNGLITLASYAALGPIDTPNRRHTAEPLSARTATRRRPAGASSARRASRRASHRSSRRLPHSSRLRAGARTGDIHGDCRSPDGEAPPECRISTGTRSAMTRRAVVSESSQPTRGGSDRSAHPGPATSVWNRGRVRGSATSTCSSAVASSCDHNTTAEGAVRRMASTRALTGRFAPRLRLGTPRSARAAPSTASGSTCCSSGIPTNSTGRASAGSSASSAYRWNTTDTHSLSWCSISTPAPVSAPTLGDRVQHRPDDLVPRLVDTDGGQRLGQQSAHRQRVEHQRGPSQTVRTPTGAG